MTKSKSNYETGKVKYFRLRAKIGEKSDGKPIIKVFYGNSKDDVETRKNNYFEKFHSQLNR